MPERFKHLLKPRGITACLQADDHLAGKLFVEGTHVMLLVMQFLLAHFAVNRVAVTIICVRA
jgi:hypothetical protein